MNEAQFDEEFNVEAFAQDIVDKIKSEVKAKYGNRKRHKQ